MIEPSPVDLGDPRGVESIPCTKLLMPENLAYLKLDRVRMLDIIEMNAVAAVLTRAATIYVSLQAGPFAWIRLDAHH